MVDLESPQSCICASLRMAARAATRVFDTALAPAGLTVTQFSLLANVAAGGPLAMRPLARRLGMDRTTLTRTLAPLERDGLVRSLPSKDRRERLIEPTGLGRARLEQAMPLWRRTQRKVAARIGDSDARELVRALSGLGDALETAS